jgi:hypothetical protein
MEISIYTVLLIFLIALANEPKKRPTWTQWFASLDALASQAGPRSQIYPRTDLNRENRIKWVAGLNRAARVALNNHRTNALGFVPHTLRAFSTREK